jgi:hypothetical protein
MTVCWMTPLHAATAEYPQTPAMRRKMSDDPAKTGEYK